MSTKLPIADTKNNNSFREYIDRIVDGDLFHRRFETPNFIVNMMIDHSVMMTEQGYMERPESALLALTHKTTGRYIFTEIPKGHTDGIQHLTERLSLHDESAFINSGLQIMDRFCGGVGYQCVGDVYRLYRRRPQDAISSEEAKTVFTHFFEPLEEAFAISDAGDMIKFRWDGLGDTERMLIEKNPRDSLSPSFSKENDFRISMSFNWSDPESLFSFDPRTGGRDVSNALSRVYAPPVFAPVGNVDMESIKAVIDERRYHRIRDILNETRKEALEVSSQANMADGLSVKDIQKSISIMYPIIEDACRSHSSSWSLFLGQDYTKIRNRFQLLEGPLHSDILALECLLGDDEFRSAIDNGTPLRSVLADLPLMNTSKKTLAKFLHNVSANMHNREFGARTIKTEKGEFERAHLSGVPSLYGLNAEDSRSFLESVSVIQGIPGKYYNYEPSHLKRAMSLQFATKSLATSIKKVRDGEWTTQQAFSWMGQVYDHEETNRLNIEIDDTDRILSQFYMSTIASHILHASGVDPVIIDDEMDSGQVETAPLLRSMVESQPFKKMIELSQSIHRHSQSLMKIGAPNGQVGWNRAIDEDYVKNDIVITPIHSSMDMTQEGMILNHCVGTYIKDAMEGQTFIFGVRDRDGNRLSTFEVVMGDEEEYALSQHFAHSNTAPSKKECSAVDEFMKKINNGVVDFDPDTHVSEKDLEKLSDIDRSEIKLGLRYSDQDVAIEAIRHVKEMFPSIDIFEYLKGEMEAFQDLANVDIILEELESRYEQCARNNDLS